MPPSRDRKALAAIPAFPWCAGQSSAHSGFLLVHPSLSRLRASDNAFCRPPPAKHTAFPGEFSPRIASFFASEQYLSRVRHPLRPAYTLGSTQPREKAANPAVANSRCRWNSPALTPTLSPNARFAAEHPAAWQGGASEHLLVRGPAHTRPQLLSLGFQR